MREGFAKALADYAGMLAWLVAGLPVVLPLVSDGPVAFMSWRWLGYSGFYLSFGVVFWLLVTERLEGLGKRAHVGLLAFQVLAASGAIFFHADGLTAVLYIITSVYAAEVLPFQYSFAVVLGQTGWLAWASLLYMYEPLFALIQSIAYLGFQLFALFTAHGARQDAEAKARLAKLNNELRATQALLAESSRMAERVRIARELHDLIGHHLTALSLNLEVAGHLTEGKAKEHVQTSHTLAKTLLQDVREVVSAMREGGGLDIAQALRALIQDVPELQIHLDLPVDLGIDDPARAHALLRCVQEIITNTVKHAHAKNLWITFEHTPEGIAVHAHDDGRGASTVQAGNGLMGMKERLEQLGGQLSFGSHPGEGFTLDARLPVR